MNDISQQRSAREWIGHEVLDDSGSKIGAIDEIYLDDASGEPEWLAIRTGWFGLKLSFAPIAGATVEGEAMRLPYPKDMVKGAPKVDPDGHLDVSEEQELYRYYGREAAPTPTGDATRAAEHGDEEMTLSEEKLVVDKVAREAGRARLRKYVVTEDVTLTVPVQREEARVVREPIREGEREGALASGIDEEEREVVLHEEQVVAHKEVVPRERVRLETEVVTEEQEVAEQVRKEQIELDEDARKSTRR